MRYALFILFLFISTSSWSQALFGTSGGSVSDVSHQFDFSIGEAITGEATTSQNSATLGFQQPYYDFFTAAQKLETSDYQLYPNPFADGFRFNAKTEVEEYILFDGAGKEIAKSKVHSPGFKHIDPLLPKGMYNLRIHLVNKEVLNLKLVHQ